MIRHGKRNKHPAAQPVSGQSIALGAVIGIGIGVAAWIGLWLRYGALMAGAGGAAALLRARTSRLTWQQITAALGVSRQAVRREHGGRRLLADGGKE